MLQSQGEDNDNFNELFRKKEVGTELLWKFLLKIAFATEPKETTKKDLKKHLNIKSDATITFIFDVLGEFLRKRRKRSLGKRKNDQTYYQINWEAIIEFLVSDTNFDEEQQDIISGYFIHVFAIIIAFTEEFNLEITPLEIDDASLQQILTFMEFRPPTLFLFLMGNFILSFITQINLPENIEFSSTVKEFLKINELIPIPVQVLNFITFFYSTYFIQKGLDQLDFISKGKSLTIKPKNEKIDQSQQDKTSEEKEDYFDWTNLIHIIFIGISIAQPILDVLPKVDTKKSIKLEIPLVNEDSMKKEINLGQLYEFFSF